MRRINQTKKIMAYLNAKYSQEGMGRAALKHEAYCKDFIKVMAIAKDVAKAFDGKVVNVRMEREINARINAAGLGFIACLCPLERFSYVKTGYRITLHLAEKVMYGFPNEVPCRDIDMVVTENRRMDAAETIAEFDKAEGRAIKHMNQWNDAAANYDKYVAIIDELRAAEKKYQDEMNSAVCPYAWIQC